MNTPATPHFSNILVPTDFSEDAAYALERAQSLAQAFGAHLHLLHIVEMPVFVPPYAMPSAAASATDALLEQGRVELDNLVARVEGVEVTATTRLGNPSDQIVAYAAEVPCDLIVIATHGRRGLARFLLGSTTERVVRLAECPVLSVRHPKRQAEPESAAE